MGMRKPCNIAHPMADTAAALKNPKPSSSQNFRPRIRRRVSSNGASAITPSTVRVSSCSAEDVPEVNHVAPIALAIRYAIAAKENDDARANRKFHTTCVKNEVLS